jgi:hypothetical protein
MREFAAVLAVLPRVSAMTICGAIHAVPAAKEDFKK